jgi:hypothetical protein
MSSDDLFGGVSSSDTGRGGVLIPEGFYPELRLVKAEVFRQFGVTQPRTFTCDVEILVPIHGTMLRADNTRVPAEALAGQVGSGPFEQLEGNQYPSYDKQGRARMMLFLGALFGYKTPAEVDANINVQTLSLVTGDLQPSTGTVFSARVTHKLTKKGKVIQSFSEIAPVFGADGKVKVVRGKGQQTPVEGVDFKYTVGDPRSMFTAPVAAPPAPPAPPAAPAAPAIPPGWAVHPADARWLYELANPNNMRQAG